MSTRDHQLAGRVREILISEWDPIGVRKFTDADDEYDSYVPTIVRLLRDRADAHKLAHHLLHTERVNIGVGGDPDRCDRVARKLLELQ